MFFQSFNRFNADAVSLPKNVHQAVRVTPVEIDGKYYIDVRVWELGDRNTGYSGPTPKGLYLNSDRAEELVAAILKVKTFFDSPKRKRIPKAPEKMKQEVLDGLTETLNEFLPSETL